MVFNLFLKPYNCINQRPWGAGDIAFINTLFFETHTGTYFTHEAKGADDAADADTAIINAEGGHNNSDEKKEYYIWVPRPLLFLIFSFVLFFGGRGWGMGEPRWRSFCWFVRLFDFLSWGLNDVECYTGSWEDVGICVIQRHRGQGWGLGVGGIPDVARYECRKRHHTAPPQLLVFFVHFSTICREFCALFWIFFLSHALNGIDHVTPLKPPSWNAHTHTHHHHLRLSTCCRLSYEGTWVQTSKHSPTLWASPSIHHILCTKSRPSHMTTFWFTQTQVISIMKGSTSSFHPSCPPTIWWDQWRSDPGSCTCFILTGLRQSAFILSLLHLLCFFQLYYMCQYIWSSKWAEAQTNGSCFSAPTEAYRLILPRQTQPKALAVIYCFNIMMSFLEVLSAFSSRNAHAIMTKESPSLKKV